MNPVLAAVTLYLFAATLVSGFVTALLVSRSTSLTVRAFAFLSAAICIYLAGYMIELNSENLADLLFWNQIEYFGVAFYPVLWLLLALLYTNRSRKDISRRTIGLLMLIPLAVFLIRLTNPWHGLYYSAESVRLTPWFVLLVLGKGPLYYLNGVIDFICSIVPTLLFIRFTRQSPDRRPGGYLMFAASLIPFVAYVAILFDTSGIGLDYSALTLPVSMGLAAVALLRYDFLDVHGLARAAIFDSSRDAMILLDAWHQLRDSNRLARKLLPELNVNAEHYSIEQVLQQRPELLAAIRSGPTVQVEPFNLEGAIYEARLTAIADRRQQLIGYLLTLVDVTEKHLARQKLELLATRDTLTGLYNRGHFETLASLAIEQARQAARPGALLMIDIDHFKRVNDSYGHAAGDAVLKALARYMQRHFRVSDIIGRIGGEEFAVFLPGSGQAQAGRLAERFREAVMAEPVDYGSCQLNVTVSIGVAELTSASEDLEGLLFEADTALYEAKNSGRNRTVLSHAVPSAVEPVERAVPVMAFQA